MGASSDLVSLPTEDFGRSNTSPLSYLIRSLCVLRILDRISIDHPALMLPVGFPNPPGGGWIRLGSSAEIDNPQADGEAGWRLIDTV